jgi:hypothetical protein
LTFSGTGFTAVKKICNLNQYFGAKKKIDLLKESRSKLTSKPVDLLLNDLKE